MENEIKTLAKGYELTQESFSDFVSRLKHDCVGEGVNDHCTADAIFIVERKRYVFGIDTDYTDRVCAILKDSHWEDPDQFYNDHLEYSISTKLDEWAQKESECDFIDLSESDKWDAIKEIEDVTVTGMDERWEYVNSHFTKDAAEAFIKRKKHDYREGLRVYVDAQTYCWEWNEIKKALIDGKLKLAD